jgi:hypothetical protein
VRAGRHTPLHVTARRLGAQEPLRPVAKCVCGPAAQGDACETPQQKHCYRQCSGAGTCLGGYCHCRPGRWGIACQRDKAFTSDSEPNHQLGLRAVARA